MGRPWRQETKDRKRKLVAQFRDLATRKGLATSESIAAATGLRPQAVDRWLNGTVLPYDGKLQRATEKLRALPSVVERHVAAAREPVEADPLAGSFHAEVAAMGRIAETLEHLPRATRLRVLGWASERFKS